MFDSRKTEEEKNQQPYQVWSRILRIRTQDPWIQHNSQFSYFDLKLRDFQI